MTEFRTVGSAGDHPEGGLRAYEVDGEPVAVARTEAGWFAFHDTCTHNACSLADGDLEDGTVVCVCHGGTYDLRTGEVLAGPPPEPVRTYPVRVEGDEIQVGTEGSP
ncbi:MAG: non-heme iron oxygenase ferredoxin subunit [Actinobacteria bacterium]|nr:non-heme iron oxygenase ferredoxin subunit [Actinomycetota bacterium]